MDAITHLFSRDNNLYGSELGSDEVAKQYERRVDYSSCRLSVHSMCPLFPENRKSIS